MKTRWTTLPALCATLLWAVSASADIKTETVVYNQGGVPLEGRVFFDDATDTKRPGVLVVHQWMGPTDHEYGVAERLAEMGYVALVADVYGQDVRPTSPQEAGAQAGKYRADRALMRARVNAGLDALKKQSRVDAAKVAAVGYCFGGGAVIELARSGTALSGVVSFHGNLDTPAPADAKNIKTRLLVLHGADDPHVPPDQVEAFKKEMADAKVDYAFIAYPGAVHAFTQKSAGDDPKKGVAYNADADAKSWAEMKAFFAKIF